MKVAVISDIHGNMQALESVLKDIESEKCEKIFCLGDLAMAGPEPVKAIEKIKELYEKDNFNQEKFILIQGNTDEMIGDYSPEIIAKVNQFPIMARALENDVQIIPNSFKEFLRTLPKQKELEIEGVKILLVHGSPRRNDENISPDLPIENIEEMLEGVNADLILCGHTHIPCGYQTSKGQTVVNDGSVGRPFTPNPQACYAIINVQNGGFDVQHKFIDYDKQTASEILSKRDFEGADKLAKILIKPETRHMQL